MAEQTQMQLVDWLDDLTVRFLLNLPASELSSMPRLCFQVEEAQWFYEDFIRPAAAAAGNPLPSLALRQFCLLLFQHCPLLQGFSDAQLVAAYEAFLAYKVRVPVRGAILMTWDMEKLLLVKGWKKGASWSFPRGKINQEEKDLDCAIREVYEETGYDVQQAGLVPDNEKDAKYIDIAIREQHIRLFVFRGVPEDTYFEPKTRKEISKIQWYNIRDLPGFRKQKPGQEQTIHANKFYMVAPFLGPLKKWINQQRRKDAALLTNGNTLALADDALIEEQVQGPGGMLPGDISAELKNLLSIGGDIGVSNHSPAGQQAEGSTNLLALLHGHSSQAIAPTAPPVHVSPPVRVSHAQHLRNTSAGHVSSMSGHYGGPYGSAWQSQQLPPRPMAPGSFGDAANPDAAFFAQVAQAQQQQQQNEYNRSMVSQTSWQAAEQSPAVQIQGSFGVISQAPEAPQAHTLPIPKLTAHSMNLLNAFKATTPETSTSRPQSSRHPRQSSLHQTALLDLFKKASAHPNEEEEVAVPRLAAHQDQPLPQSRGEQASLSAAKPITKAESSAIPTANVMAEHVRKGGSETKRSNTDNYPPQRITETASSRKPSRRSPDSATQRLAPAFTILQRPPSRAPQSPGPKSPKVRQNASPKLHGPPKRSETHTPTTPFTILARPGSSRGSPSQIPDGSKPTFQPQLLKRPESSAVSPVTESRIPNAAIDNHEGTKDKLLALFGKASSGQGTDSSANLMSKAPESPALEKNVDQRKTALLNLLGAPNASSSSKSPSAMQPPTHAPDVSGRDASKKQSQPGALLDIFKQPSTTVTSHAEIPGSTAAPSLFENTAGQSRLLAQTWQSGIPFTTGTVQEPKSRIPSITSVRDSSVLSSGHVTPTESKGFLLNYLNGVVQQEAQRRKT